MIWRRRMMMIWIEEENGDDMKEENEDDMEEENDDDMDRGEEWR
jgi:hypothetical protein